MFQVFIRHLFSREFSAGGVGGGTFWCFGMQADERQDYWKLVDIPFHCSSHVLLQRMHGAMDIVYGVCANFMYYKKTARGELTLFRGKFDLPRCVLRDFNRVRKSTERHKGIKMTVGMQELNSWINDRDLLELPIPNYRFTWSDSRIPPLCPSWIG